jgi:hypothetical protein
MPIPLLDRRFEWIDHVKPPPISSSDAKVLIERCQPLRDARVLEFRHRKHGGADAMAAHRTDVRFDDAQGNSHGDSPLVDGLSLIHVIKLTPVCNKHIYASTTGTVTILRRMALVSHVQGLRYLRIALCERY